MADYFDYGNYHFDTAYGETKANTHLNTHRYTRNDIRVAENQLTPSDPYTNSKVQTSTNIFIYANGGIVGMVQSMNISETRQINKLQAVGWEGVVQSVPSNTKGGQIQLQRIALYDSTMFGALGLTTNALPQNSLGSKIHNIDRHTESDKWDDYTTEQAMQGKRVSEGLTFRTLKDQRAPIEIQVKTPLYGDQAKFYTTTYIDVWLSSISRTMNVNTITVAESATAMYGDVY